MDAATGQILNTFNVVPDGCTGGSVWGSPTIDEQTGMLYVGTGSPGQCATKETMALSLLELNASNLSYVASWKVPRLKGDFDFGSTPTLFQATINGTQRQMVGLLNKDGTYYALDRNNIAAGTLWQDALAVKQRQGGGDNIASSAWDGTALYVAANKTTINGTPCAGSLSAINPADGTFLWQDCLSDHILGSLMAVPGLVVVGVGDHLYAVSTADGSILFDYLDTSGHTKFIGTATISNGVLYAGDTTGNLFAFVP
jgi:polyvinyl alcohol dehydrogenase (cytochrome)